MKKPDFFSEHQRVVRTHYQYHEHPAEPNLAITPAQVDNMARRGIPVSSFNYGLQFGGLYSSDSETIPIEFTRGFDKIDAWNLQQTARKKVNNARKKDEQIYG